MGEYQVVISLNASGDIENIYHYIANVLKSPDAADRMAVRLEEKILSLSRMPERTPVVIDQMLDNYKIRLVLTGNYDIFYYIDEENKKINILRVMFDRMNWREYFVQFFTATP